MNAELQLKAIYIAIVVISLVAIIWFETRRQKRAKQVTRYVLGFCYNAEASCRETQIGTSGFEMVLLIRKNKPNWQRGKLNGVGGKIEKGEHSRQAMTREFQEETGVVINPKKWSYFACMKGNGFEVHCFAIADKQAFSEAQTIADEKIERHSVLWVASSTEVIPNLKFLVPMGADALYDPNFSLIVQQQQLHLMNLD